MVLQEAISSDSDPFMQDAPSSDRDAYSSEPPANGGSPQDVTIDVTKLPRLWGPFGSKPIGKTGFDGILQQCKFASSILQRPLRQDEADALAYHFAKSLHISSLGGPVGASIGCLWAYRDTKTFSFLFWTPKKGGSFNPDKFGPFKGPLARNLWQLLRLQVYGTAGAFFASVFFGSYAVSVDAAGKATDTRLKEFNEALRTRMKEGRMSEPLRPPPGQRAPVTSQEGQMDAQRENARQRLERSRSRTPQRRQRDDNDDDMSPTSGAWAEENSGVSSDSGLLSDAQMRSQEARQQADARSSPAETRANTFDMDKVTKPPTGFDQGDTARPDASKSRPSGSVWERIRAEAASSKGQGQGQGQQRGGARPQSNVQAEQRQGSTLGDSFSFSETDEERQLAKTEAQRDFDARIEKERHGGDFEESKRGQRRW